MLKRKNSYTKLKISKVSRPKSIGLLASEVFSSENAAKILGISNSYYYKLRKKPVENYSDNIIKRIIKGAKKLGIDENSMHLDITENVNIIPTLASSKLLKNRKNKNIQITFKLEKYSGQYKKATFENKRGFTSFVARRSTIKTPELLSKKINEYIESQEYNNRIDSGQGQLFITSISIRKVE